MGERPETGAEPGRKPELANGRNPAGNRGWRTVRERMSARLTDCGCGGMASERRRRATAAAETASHLRHLRHLRPKQHFRPQTTPMPSSRQLSAIVTTVINHRRDTRGMSISSIVDEKSSYPHLGDNPVDNHRVIHSPIHKWGLLMCIMCAWTGITSAVRKGDLRPYVTRDTESRTSGGHPGTAVGSGTRPRLIHCAALRSNAIPPFARIRLRPRRFAFMFRPYWSSDHIGLACGGDSRSGRR